MSSSMISCDGLFVINPPSSILPNLQVWIFSHIWICRINVLSWVTPSSLKTAKHLRWQEGCRQIWPKVSHEPANSGNCVKTRWNGEIHFQHTCPCILLISNYNKSRNIQLTSDFSHFRDISFSPSSSDTCPLQKMKQKGCLIYFIS